MPLVSRRSSIRLRIHVNRLRRTTSDSCRSGRFRDEQEMKDKERTDIDVVEVPKASSHNCKNRALLGVA